MRVALASGWGRPEPNRCPAATHPRSRPRGARPLYRSRKLLLCTPLPCMPFCTRLLQHCFHCYPLLQHTCADLLSSVLPATLPCQAGMLHRHSTASHGWPHMPPRSCGWRNTQAAGVHWPASTTRRALLHSCASPWAPPSDRTAGAASRRERPGWRAALKLPCRPHGGPAAARCSLPLAGALPPARAGAGAGAQGAFLWMSPAPYSRYSALDIHICGAGAVGLLAS